MGSGALSQTERTVLVVDDDPGVIQILEANLRHANFAVISAANGAQALAKASRERPNLILLDVILPDLDGIDVCRRLKQSRQTSQIPVIMISAKVESADIIAGIAAGAEDYITKPFTPSEVVALVEAHLRQAQQAENANPVTGLPGSSQVSSLVNALISQDKPRAAMYVDMDSLKAFNDVYGFAQGDRAIQVVAEILREAVHLFGNPDDLVGHRDGDNFVVITTPQRAQTLCQRIFTDFDSRIRTLYDPKDLQRGYIGYEGRLGQREQYPIMTLSIAVVTNEKRRIDSYLQANEIAAELMGHIKSLPGSNYRFDRRQNNIVVQRTLAPKDTLSSHRQELRATQGALVWLSFLMREMEAPVSMIKDGLDSLLLEGWAENLDPQQLKCLESIGKCTGQLMSMLEELESLKSVEWDGLETALDEVYLKKTLDQVMGLVQGLAKERGVEVEIQDANDISQLMVDERALTQGLFYLLRSEVESSAPGDRVVVSVAGERDAFIDIEIINRTHYIPPQELAALFRAQRKSVTNRGRRNDLNLAMILVQGLGGKVKVESQEEEGTVFTVLVPKRWRSWVERINRLQSDTEKSCRAARAQLSNIRHFLSSTGEQVPSALDESLQGLDSRMRELEVLCNRSLLLADDLSSDLETQQDRILEHEAEQLAALETMLSIAREIAKSARAGYLFDLDSARRVSRYAMAVAAGIKLPRGEQQALHYAALLKDLSLALAPQEVFDRRRRLTAERYAKLKERLATLNEELARVNFLAPALSLVAYRYERYDGTGHPSGLKGAEIPLGAKILALVDVFDAMTSGLPHPGALEVEAAVQEIAADSGRGFDPQVVSVFLQAWRSGKLWVE